MLDRQKDVMCRRSRALQSAMVAALTGTLTEQLLVGVDPGAMPIAPLDPKPISSHQPDRDGANVGRNSARIQQRSSGHLFDTAGTGTRQPKLPRWIERLMISSLPLDQKPII